MFGSSEFDVRRSTTDFSLIPLSTILQCPRSRSFLAHVPSAPEGAGLWVAPPARANRSQAGIVGESVPLAKCRSWASVPPRTWCLTMFSSSARFHAHAPKIRSRVVVSLVVAALMLPTAGCSNERRLSEGEALDYKRQLIRRGELSASQIDQLGSDSARTKAAIDAVYDKLRAESAEQRPRERAFLGGGTPQRVAIGSFSFEGSARAQTLGSLTLNRKGSGSRGKDENERQSE